MPSSGASRESALVGFYAASRTAPDDPGVRLEEKPFLGHVNLRGNPDDRSFLSSVRDTLGFDLPVEANTFARASGVTAIWLGPDEWLIVKPVDGQSQTVASLRDALGETHAAVTDVTGGQTVLNLSGRHARDVLGKGCSLDLHPRAFGPRQCAQSNLAKAAITLLQIDDAPSYDVIVRRSFAVYLAQWIEDAASEYGLELA